MIDTNTLKNGSNDIVTFDVVINGIALPQVIKIFSIDVWQEINRIPRAKIIVLDGDPILESFTVSEQKWFVPGNQIEIFAGYHSDNSLIFSGIITAQSIKIRELGNNSLTIDCSDKAVKMTLAPRSRHFYYMKESDIFNEIIQGYEGVTSTIEPTQVQHLELLQYQCTDWDFIINRVEVNNMFCVLSSGKLDIQKPDFSGKPVHTIIFGRNLLELDASLDPTTQVMGVKGGFWDYSKSEMTFMEAMTETPVVPGMNDADDSSAIDSHQWELQNSGKIPDELLQSWTNAKLLKHEMAKNRGRVRIKGAVVSVGNIVTLNGLGDRFNGNAYVSGVKHSIGAGEWLTDLQYGLSPKWFSEQHHVSSRPAAGMLPAVSGLQVGLVSQLEGDPTGDDRILVRFPVIGEDEQGIWARITTIGAGQDRGLVYRPEIGDEVIVGFIDDDPNQPIILGSVHSANHPSPINPEDDNHLKGIQTRGKVKLMIDDKKPSVFLEMPSGRRIIADDDTGQIILEDSDGNKLALNSAGISIESAGNIEIKADGKITINAGTNLSAEAGATIKAAGSSGAEVSSSGVTKIKGSLVQIN